MRYVDPEQMALEYWLRMRGAALKEVEIKLSQFRHASPNTIKYWLAVHAILERRAAPAERKAYK